MAKQDVGSFRLHPKLRVIRNGDDLVNSQRALRSCIVTSTMKSAVGEDPSAAEATDANPRRKPARRLKLSIERRAKRAFVNVFVEMKSSRAGADGRAAGLEAMKRLLESQQSASPNSDSPEARIESNGNVLRATVPVDLLPVLETHPDVAFIQAAEPIRLDQPAVQPEGPRSAPPSKRLESRLPIPKSNVLVGIIDVGGFDFAHPDFLDRNGKTRFLRIWDQGGDFRPPPAEFHYGAEFTQERLNAALDAAASSKIPATRLEQQSQRDIGSHGTHVASIAAGNKGICPHAYIAGVVISLPTSGEDVESKRSTFREGLNNSPVLGDNSAPRLGR